MAEVLEYEPHIRKERLLSLLDTLADPNITLATLKDVTKSDAIPYVWRWQDDLEGHFFKEKTEVTEPLGKATASLIRLLQDLVTKNNLPQVVDASSNSSLVDTPSTDEADPVGNSAECSSRQSSESSVNSIASQPTRPGSPPADRDERKAALSDTDMQLEGEFVSVPDVDAEFITLALSFLFHAADGSGGAVYNLLDAVNFLDLGRVTCSLLYVINLKVSTAAARVLGQVVGASRYFPPASVPHLLLSMALNVPCGNGSSVKANSRTLSSFAHGEIKLEDVLQMLGRDSKPEEKDMANTFLDTAKKRLVVACGDACERRLLIAQQAYSVAALMVLLGETGFECVLLSRAPNALSALIDVCRDDARSPEDLLLKSSIVESLTIFLSFMGSAHNTRLFKRLQLAPLLSEFHKLDINERYFYQLCDLASFAPSQTITYPLKMIQLSTTAGFSSEAKLRSIDVLTRTFDPPMHLNGVVSDQIADKVYLELFKAFENDLNELLTKLELCVTSPRASYEKLCSERIHELVTERLDALNLFIIPLTWTSIERTVLRSSLVDRLLSIMTLPLLLETLPTRAIHIAADTLARICETEQGRMLLLDEQGLKFSIYDAVVLLARSHNRQLDLLPAIEALYMCLWGSGGQDNEWSGFDADTAQQTEQSDSNLQLSNHTNGLQFSNSRTDINGGSNSQTPDLLEDNAGQNLFNELDLALMRMATDVILHSFCERLPELLLKYSRRAAKECLASFTAVVRNAIMLKVENSFWMPRLAEKYLAVDSESTTRPVSIELNMLVCPLYSAHAVSGVAAGAILHYAVLSGDTQLLKVVKHPVLKEFPQLLANYCRLYIELATDGFPHLLVRFLHYSSLMTVDRSETLAPLLPGKVLVSLILLSLKFTGTRSQEDHEDFESLIDNMDQKYCSEFIRQVFDLLSPGTPSHLLGFDVQTEDSEIQINLLNLLQKLLTFDASSIESAHIDILTGLIGDHVVSDDTFGIQDTLLSLISEVLDLEVPVGIKDELISSLEKIVSKGGLPAFEALQGVFSESCERKLLLEQLQVSRLTVVLRDHQSSVLRVVRGLSSEFVASNSDMLLGLLSNSFDTLQRELQQSGPRYCDSWLQLITQLTIRLASSEPFEADPKFHELLKLQVESLIRAISKQAPSAPRVFMAVHAMLLNILNVQALIELGSSARNQGPIDFSRETLSALSGIPYKLFTAEVSENLLRASVAALESTVTQPRVANSKGVESERESDICGLSFLVGTIIQSDIEVATLAVELDVVGRLINTYDHCPPQLESSLDESILGISHVIFTSPAVMAGLMIGHFINRGSGRGPSEDEHAEHDLHSYSEPDALLMRRPNLNGVLEEIYGMRPDGSVVPFSEIEQLARRTKVDLKRPESLDYSKYATLPIECQRKTINVLLKYVEEGFASDSASSKAKISMKILLDYLSLSGKTRSLLISGNDHLLQKIFLQFAVSNDFSGRDGDRGRGDGELMHLFVNLIANLTIKSRAEHFNHSTRKSLERSTRFVLKLINHALTKKVPEFVKSNRRSAVSVLLTCVEVIRLVWGDSSTLLAGLPSLQNASGEKIGSELAQHKLMKNMRVVENLIAALSHFDFSWEAMGKLKMSALRFVDCLIFQELFQYDVQGDEAVQSKPPKATASNDQWVGRENSEPSVSRDARSHSDEDEDVMESESVEDRRSQHRQRVEASHGNTFRNSSLGEYESSSSDSLLSDESEGSYDYDSESGTFTESDSYTSESYESDPAADSPLDNADIMLVLSQDEDEDASSFHSSDEYDSEGDESNDSFFNDNDEEPSSDSEAEAEYEIVLGDTAEDSYTRRMVSGDPNEGRVAPVSHGDHQFELDNEVLLLYDERREEDHEGQHHKSIQVSSRTKYLRSVFEYTDELDPSGSQCFYGDLRYQYAIRENSNLIWDSLALPLDSERTVRSIFDSTTIARRSARARKDSEDDPYTQILDSDAAPPQVIIRRKDEDAPRSSFFPQLLALLARVCFSDAFDLELDLILHCIIALAGTSTGRQLFKTLIHILLEASSGHIDSVYASLTRIAASGSSARPADAQLSLKVKAYSSPALVCSNILTLLEMLFSADFIVENPRFLWNNGNNQVCEFDGYELFYLDTISSMAKKLLEKQGAEILGMVSNPVISGNRRLLELASSFLDSITTASSDTWDPTAPGDYTDEELQDEDDSDYERIKLSIDEHKTSKLLSVLSSRECNFRVFSSVVKILKKHIDSRVLIEPLVKEIRRAKHLLIMEGRKVLEGQNNVSGEAELKGQHDFLEAQLQFLRLLNVVGSIFVGEKCLHVFQKVDLPPLWTKIFAVIEYVHQMEGLVPQLMLSLLEVVTLPADIVFREYDSLSGQADRSERLYSKFIGNLTNTLQTCMPKYGSIVNELIRVKPKLLGGPLGAMALRFKIVDFKNKCDWLSQEIYYYQNERYAEERRTFIINRGSVFNDSLSLISGLKGEELLYPFNIEFENEPGVDEGGVMREWFEILSREILNPLYGLFCPTSPGSSIYQIRPPLEGVQEQERIFRFVGRVIGRAVYDQYTVGLYFSRVVYKYFLGDPITLADMESFDESYYKSLRWMLENDITDVFYENFSVELDNYGTKEVEDLIPNGRNISVDESNKHDYVQKIVEFKLITCVKGPLDAMKQGFYDVLLKPWVKTFNDQELELLICGLPYIDIDDWHANTQYEGYNAGSKQVRWFWLVVRSFSPELRAKLLQFSTGTSRVPAQGFGHLESNTDSGKFIISREKGNKDRLPSAHTCMNQLCIPEYDSFGKLRKLLLKAITEGNEGFGFI